MTSNIIKVNSDGVVLQGYHKKLKTMKKKYFVLYAEKPTQSARLEYYDSEKKFKSRSNPKRTIILNNCFNIFRRLDTKYKYVISLSMKDEGFCIVLDSEDELNKWLRTLLALQRGENAVSDPPKPTFEHVWQVVVRPKGLAEEKGILGSYYVCLTLKSLTLIPIGHDRDKRVKVDFLLTTIRRCGNSQCYFYMEVGRYSAFGAGELWMETTDPLIAQNMHTMIINAMTNSVKNRDDNASQMRKRSSSANETSKPISVMEMRQTNSSNRPLNSSPLNESPSATASTTSSTTAIQSPLIKPTSNKKATEQKPQISATITTSKISSTIHYCINLPQDCKQQRPGSTVGRERCDSLPSRNRTTSDSSNRINSTVIMPPPRTIPTTSNRPHSMYTSSRHSHSPPINTTLSPSTGCSESEGSSLSIDETDSFDHSLTPDESGNFISRYYNSCSSGVIPEENCDDYWYATVDSNKQNSNDRTSGGDGSVDPASVHHDSLASSLLHYVGSSETQSGQYMDMCSPCGSSPCDQTDGNYMIPISPAIEFSSLNRGLYVESSGGHSRASSLVEDTTDGYVPMCPSTSTQDYVDMEQRSKQQNLSGLSSAASSCSITSGTPSTDVRFAEYPLDKVQSRFTPDDEDIRSNIEKPIRTYSVGSRLEHNKRKLRIDILNADQNISRVRAFSVGSRAKVPRCDIIYRGGGVQTSMGCQNSNNYNTEVNSIVGSYGSYGSSYGSSNSGGKGKKSSSAPLLIHKSQSSVDRMSDLMEIDFSKNAIEQRNNNMNNSHDDATSANIIASLPVRLSSFPVQIPGTSTLNSLHYHHEGSSVEQINNDNSCSPKLNDNSIKLVSSSSINAVTGGYVEMKPSLEKILNKSAITAVDTCGYLEMKPVGSSSSPTKSLPSTLFPQKPTTKEQKLENSSSSSSFISPPKTKNSTNNIINNDYINVSPSSSLSSSRNYNNNNTNDNNNNSNDNNIDCHNHPSCSLLLNSSLSNEKLMEVDDYTSPRFIHHPFSSSHLLDTPEGYMEMSFNQVDRLSSPSLAFSTITSSSISTTTLNSHHSTAGHSISLPIDIIKSSKDNKKIDDISAFELSDRSNLSSTTSRYQTGSIDSNHHHSITTPLQFSSSSNNNSSSQLTSSVATIFPFSLGSPFKLPASSSSASFNILQNNRKCLIDGTGGTLTISEDQNKCNSFNKNDHDRISNRQQQKRSSLPSLSFASKEIKILNTDMIHQQKSHSSLSPSSAKCSEYVEALSNDYAEMSLIDDDNTLVSGKVSNTNNNVSSNSNSSNLMRSQVVKTTTKVPMTLSSNNGGSNNNLAADYVNYIPRTQQEHNISSTSTSTKFLATSKLSTIDNDLSGDYAIMKPLSVRIKPLASTNTVKEEEIINKKQLKPFEGFKPIAEPNNEMFLRNKSSSTNDYGGDNSKPTRIKIKNVNSSLPKSMLFTSSPTTTTTASPNSITAQSTKETITKSNSQHENESGYELIQIRSDSFLATITTANSPFVPETFATSKKFISRPSSVNSDKISPLKGTYSNSSSTVTSTVYNNCQRPNSVNSDYISQSSISASSSTSTLCSGNSVNTGFSGGSSTSSSSTLCGSKSQSPLTTNSHPQSFSCDSMITNITLNSDQSNVTTAINNVIASSTSLSGSNTVTTQSRPPSVTSERELHYASLDLPAPTTTSTHHHCHHHRCHVQNSNGNNGSGNSSPNCSSNFGNNIVKVNYSIPCEELSSSACLTLVTNCSNQQQQEPTFTYAQIDFHKSESLKTTITVPVCTTSSFTTSANNQ